MNIINSFKKGGQIFCGFLLLILIVLIGLILLIHRANKAGSRIEQYLSNFQSKVEETNVNVRKMNELVDELEKKFLSSEVLKKINRDAEDYFVRIEQLTERAVAEQKKDKKSYKVKMIKKTYIGSGFFISKNEIYTNAHNIEDALKITIKFKKRQISPLKIYLDQKTDIATIIVPEQSDVKIPLLGNSDQTQVGDFAITIGNPDIMNSSFSFGVISAVNRFLPKRPFTDFFQTDALIKKGSSGGLLLNIKGEIIGVSTLSTEDGSAIGFAIPINEFQKIVEELKNKEKIRRAFWGIDMINVYDWDESAEEEIGLKKPAASKGAIVLKVRSETPAEKAGFQKNDLILKFDGIEIEDIKQLIRLATQEKYINKKPEVEIMRDGKTMFLYPVLTEAN